VEEIKVWRRKKTKKRNWSSHCPNSRVDEEGLGSVDEKGMMTMGEVGMMMVMRNETDSLSDLLSRPFLHDHKRTHLVDKG